MRDHVLSTLSFPVRVVVGLLIYRHTTQTLYGQGTGRYTADEIRLFRREIWEAINGLLISSRARATVNGAPRDQPFWVLEGEYPTEADATLFGFIVSVLVSKAYVYLTLLGPLLGLLILFSFFGGGVFHDMTLRLIGVIGVRSHRLLLGSFQLSLITLEGSMIGISRIIRNGS